MTKKERQLVEEALYYLNQLPSGIDPEGVDEDDLSPEDAMFHVGSIAAKRIIAAMNASQPGRKLPKEPQ